MELGQVTEHYSHCVCLPTIHPDTACPLDPLSFSPSARDVWSGPCSRGGGGLQVEEKKEGMELGFVNELEIISRASHKNLAQCQGFCVDRDTQCLCLVLKFYSNGSVASRTQGRHAVLACPALPAQPYPTLPLSCHHWHCQPGLDPVVPLEATPSASASFLSSSPMDLLPHECKVRMQETLVPASANHS